jgi:hypothetical protein
MPHLFFLPSRMLELDRRVDDPELFLEQRRQVLRISVAACDSHPTVSTTWPLKASIPEVIVQSAYTPEGSCGNGEMPSSLNRRLRASSP